MSGTGDAQNVSKNLSGRGDPQNGSENLLPVNADPSGQEDPLQYELDDIRAITMKNLINSSEDGSKRLMFFTNRQAALFTADRIPKILGAMGLKRGWTTIKNGMLKKFKSLEPLREKHPELYQEYWKRWLRQQAQNDPDGGPGQVSQDLLPIPPFLHDYELDGAEWKMECFMREVLVPLAAENKALIFGSAARDATLMMMFGRVASSMSNLWGGAATVPWTMLGFAAAPKLIMAVKDKNCVASEWFQLSKRWQARADKIERAKILDGLKQDRKKHKSRNSGVAEKSAEDSGVAEKSAEDSDKDENEDLREDADLHDLLRKKELNQEPSAVDLLFAAKVDWKIDFDFESLQKPDARGEQVNSEGASNSEVAVDQNKDGKVDDLEASKQIKTEMKAQKKRGFTRQIPYDVNEFLRTLIVVDCVKEESELSKKDGRVVVSGLDQGPKNKLEETFMDYFVQNVTVIGAGTFHAQGGFDGLSKAASYLNLRIPLLFLDVRDRDLPDRKVDTSEKLNGILEDMVEGMDENIEGMRMDIERMDENMGAEGAEYSSRVFHKLKKALEKAREDSSKKNEDRKKLKLKASKAESVEKLDKEIKQLDEEIKQLIELSIVFKQDIELTRNLYGIGKDQACQPGKADIDEPGKADIDEPGKADIDEVMGRCQPGKADIYEVCRVSHLHSLFLTHPELTISANNGGDAAKLASGGTQGDSQGDGQQSGGDKLALQASDSLGAAIRKAREKIKNAESSGEFRQKILDLMVEHCVHMEFWNYWLLKSKRELKELDEKGIKKYAQEYGEMMVAARTAYQQVLSSEYLYTAKADDIARIKNIINQSMLKKDRLPKQPSLDGLLMLRAAWDVVDIGNSQIEHFKLIAKVCYLLLLAIGIAVVAVTVETAAIDAKLGAVSAGEKTLQGSQLITFCLSLVATFVSAVQAFYNPVRRWQQVRDFTAEMESAIWQYRTRTGAFKEDNYHAHNISIGALAACVRKCNDAIMKSADMQETDFYKIYPPKIFKHGQRDKIYPPKNFKHGQRDENEGAGGEGNKDSSASDKNKRKVHNDPEYFADPEAPEAKPTGSEQDGSSWHDQHHSPVTPEAYILFRILKMIRFYQRRLPRYSRGRSLGSWTIMIGSVVGTLISFLGYAPQVAIISASTAAISAYMEFHSTAQKLKRYNATILGLKNVILWWDSLNTVEKANPLHIDKLVDMAEALINQDRAAWLSTTAPDEEGKDKDSKGKDDKDEKKKKEK